MQVRSFSFKKAESFPCSSPPTIVVLVPGEDLEDLQPPVGLLLAGALDEVDPLRGGDGHAVGVTRHLVSPRHLHHLVHVNACLRKKLSRKKKI